jgi:hypothetical protein
LREEEAIQHGTDCGVLKQAKFTVAAAEVIRKAEIHEQTFYRWKAKDQVRPDEDAARREPAVEASDGRVDGGQRNVAGCALKVLPFPPISLQLHVGKRDTFFEETSLTAP